eukprot:4297-Heterococcus_DN1.PRE.1
MKRKACRVSAHHFSPQDLKKSAKPGGRRTLRHGCLPVSYRVSPAEQRDAVVLPPPTVTELQEQAFNALNALEGAMANFGIPQEHLPHVMQDVRAQTMAVRQSLFTMGAMCKDALSRSCAVNAVVSSTPGAANSSRNILSASGPDPIHNPALLNMPAAAAAAAIAAVGGVVNQGMPSYPPVDPQQQHHHQMQQQQIFEQQQQQLLQQQQQ